MNNHGLTISDRAAMIPLLMRRAEGRAWSSEAIADLRDARKYWKHLGEAISNLEEARDRNA